MTPRSTSCLCLALVLVAATASGQEPETESPELVLPDEDASIRSLRQKLARIGAALTAGVPLAEIEDVRLLERDREKVLEDLHRILMTLASPEDQKIAVVRILEAWKSSESVYPLLLVLDDSSEDYRVRYEIVLRIASFEDERAVIPLADVLKGKETRLHAPAARSFARFGANERARRYYRPLLVHAEPSTRGWTARSLGWSGWSEAPSILLEAEARESDPAARAQVLFALAETGAPEGIERVVAGTAHPNERVRGKACEALGLYGAAAGEAARKALLGRLADAAEAEGVRGTAAWTLWRVAQESDEVALALVAAMGGGGEMLDNSAKSALQYMKSRAMVDALVRILGDGKETGRRRAGALAVLRAVTGIDLGEKAGAWQEWWDANRDRFAFPRAAATQKRE